MLRGTERRKEIMIDGNKLGAVGFEKLGTLYREMDCQAFIEWCLRQCGLKKDLAGSNAWYREVMKNGTVMTPEECVKQLGKVPAGAFLFIHAFDGGEEKRGYRDGLGNASHIGIVTGKGEGAIHSSSSRGCVAESRFRGKTIRGGWNRVGLWNKVRYEGCGEEGGAERGENRIRNLNRRDSPQGSSLVSIDLTTDETPATGGHRWFALCSARCSALRKGDRGEAVREMQEALMARGYDLGKWGADGIFGTQTLKAVKVFQGDCGLKADGIIGPLTMGKLRG